MSLRAEEFIRRFLLHTLPLGFQRIRHYGLLASRNKQRLLQLCRTLLDAATDLLPSAAQMTACVRQLIATVAICPQCRVGEMMPIQILPPQPWNAAPGQLMIMAPVYNHGRSYAFCGVNGAALPICCSASASMQSFAHQRRTLQGPGHMHHATASRIMLDDALDPRC